jgi:hypothetical protein
MFISEAKRTGALDADFNGFVGLDNVDGFTYKRRA